MEIVAPGGLTWIDRTFTEETATPGPKLPLPQALSKLRHTKKNIVRGGFVTVFVVATFTIVERVDAPGPRGAWPA